MVKLLKETKLVQAIRDYITNEESLLSFKRNDIIKIVNRNYTPQGWLRGELDGKKGLFPVEYVRSVSKSGVNSQVCSNLNNELYQSSFNFFFFNLIIKDCGQIELFESVERERAYICLVEGRKKRRG
jgi:hypothetical protein